MIKYFEAFWDAFPTLVLKYIYAFLGSTDLLMD